MSGFFWSRQCLAINIDSVVTPKLPIENGLWLTLGINFIT